MPHPHPETPQTIDINLSGDCNLRCAFCWGPLHERSEIDEAWWRRTLLDFRQRGVLNSVFTGGEPLIIPQTPTLIAYAKGLGYHTTLSTNGMFHEALEAVLPYLDEVGIPLDGSTDVLNARMRPPGKKHFYQAMQAMQIVKHRKPEINLTVRTVVSRVNFDDIRNIGQLLGGLNPDIMPNRWKLYQFTPTGAYGSQAGVEYSIEEADFYRVFREMQASYPQLKVEELSTVDRSGRYVFVMPNGDVSVVQADGVSYRHLGNLKVEGMETIYHHFTINAITEHHLTHGILA